MSVPLLDLKAQYRTIKGEIDAAVAEVFESQYFILGPTVTACEESLAKYCQADHAVGVSSGTDALLIALMVEGIGAGDEVITTPYSFFATAGSVHRVGAKPVFVDVEHESFNIDPAKIEEKITPRTKAIIPVHLYGQCAEMAPILEIAKKHGLVVIEDAAQAIGSEYMGRRAGSMGDYGCFSFFPSKNLGGAGDGGLVTTNDDDKAKRLQWYRNHGAEPKYYHAFVGGNFRLDALQAAVISVKLTHLDAWSAGRQRNAERYRALFTEKGLVGNGVKELPKEIMNRHIYNQFVLRVEKREELRQYMRDQNVGCEVYYPVPLHLQECFKDLGYKPGDMPESELAADETLAIPIYPELTDAQAQEVVDTIAAFYAG
jgi:dTDP-4-amino-4,6-dideoxygalactose transaminase